MDRFSSRRMRHVDVKHHIVRDTINGRLVCAQHMRLEEEHADILTKALT